MCLNISFIALKTSKSSLAESILINLQPGSCFIVFIFLFCSQYFCRYDPFYQFLLQAYSHENLSQSYILTRYIVFACFLIQMNFFIFVSTNCSLVKMKSYCLNPNLVLNLCAGWCCFTIYEYFICYSFLCKNSVRFFFLLLFIYYFISVLFSLKDILL